MCRLRIGHQTMAPYLLVEVGIFGGCNERMTRVRRIFLDRFEYCGEKTGCCGRMVGDSLRRRKTWKNNQRKEKENQLERRREGCGRECLEGFWKEEK